MKKVRITFAKNDYLLRQTPNQLGIWGNYQFTFDEVSDADYWIVVNNYYLTEVFCNCPSENIIYLLQEPTNVSKYNNDNHSQEFLNQFGVIITVQPDFKGQKVINSQIGAPWFVEKNFDELVALKPPLKSKVLSIITSDKTYTKGHRDRIECAMKIKKYFGDYVDLFGRGFQDFDSKWDVLAPYKYHIAIENSSENNYFTEKLVDPMLAFTLPLYYGCPNISDYFQLPDYLKISNLSSFENIKRKIKYLIESEDIYANNLLSLNSSRKKILYEYQFFPMMTAILDNISGTKSKTNKIFYKRIKESKFKTLEKVIRRKIFMKRLNILYD